MRYKRIFFLLIASMLILSIIFSPLYAGWIDDWIAQKIESSPSSFESQARNYYFGGAFSARWPMKRDYLFTVEPPRISGGCNGLDIFLGSLGMLNFEYLVTKLQRILQAAPAAAFDIALKTLCEPCSNTIKSLEAIADALNSLQLDDCKLARNLAVEVLYPLAPEKLAKDKAEADQSFSIFKGLFKMTDEVKKRWENSGGAQASDVGETGKLSGCPPDLLAIFSNTDGRNLTILQRIAERKGYAQSHMDLIRGFVGDIRVVKRYDSNNKDMYVPELIPPCDENIAHKLSIFDGKAAVRPANGGPCMSVTDAKANIEGWMQDTLINIAKKYESKTKLTPEEFALVKKSPIPVYLAMKVASLGKNVEVGAATVAAVISRAYAYSMMMDLYNILVSSLLTAESLATAQGGRKTPYCQIELLSGQIGAVKEMRNRAYELIGRVQSDYARVTNEILVIQQLTMNYQKFDEMVKKELTERFGSGPARRATGG